MPSPALSGVRLPRRLFPRIALTLTSSSLPQCTVLLLLRSDGPPHLRLRVIPCMAQHLLLEGYRPARNQVRNLGLLYPRGIMFQL